MATEDLRFAALKLLQNDLLLAHERAEKLGLEVVVSLLAMALAAMPLNRGPPTKTVS